MLFFLNEYKQDKKFLGKLYNPCYSQDCCYVKLFKAVLPLAWLFLLGAPFGFSIDRFQIIFREGNYKSLGKFCYQHIEYLLRCPKIDGLKNPSLKIDKLHWTNGTHANDAPASSTKRETECNVKLCFVCVFRYYGVRKPTNKVSQPLQQTLTVAQHGGSVLAATKKHMPVAKPIITVTEFTPGNTPDQVCDKIFERR